MIEHLSLKECHPHRHVDLAQPIWHVDLAQTDMANGTDAQRGHCRFFFVNDSENVQ